MSWLKENWFRINILILLVIAISIYGYDIYWKHQPKSVQEIKEKDKIELLNKLKERICEREPDYYLCD